MHTVAEIMSRRDKSYTVCMSFGSVTTSEKYKTWKLN